MANASTIINDEMSLEEKLAAIDAAMEQAKEKASELVKNVTGSDAKVDAPVDPQSFLMCEGCQ